MAYSRQTVVQLMRQLGYPRVADAAERELPDPVEIEQLIAFGDQHGVSRGEMMDRMGGSP